MEQEEHKRRNAFKVGIVYIAMACSVMQVADVMRGSA